MTEEEFENRTYRYASDLISEIKKHGDMFLAGACYPEVHPESANQDDDIMYLKQKVLITQMFFDNKVFYDFRDKIRKAGIEVPIHTGIMPITVANQLGTSVQLSGSSVPNELSSVIAKYGENPDDMKKAGIEYAINQINDLKNNGVDGIHIYTMNKADVTMAIYEGTFA